MTPILHNLTYTTLFLSIVVAAPAGQEADWRTYLGDIKLEISILTSQYAEI